jgi:hypothetical protein
MWIGATQLLEGPLVVSCLRSAGGGGVGGAGIYGRNWLACLVGGIFGK